MNPRVRAVLARNGGFITTPQAYDAGLSVGHIRSAVTSGKLVAIRRGVYA